MKSKCFEPVARADARVLILGSPPGKVSLERGEYYAQPYNAFWRIMGELVGASRDLPYQARLGLLRQNRIASWDVCATGFRAGSLDSAIELSTVRANDVGGFLRVHPDVGLICFNGKKAKEIYDRKVRLEPGTLFERIRIEVLPSTSPANTMRYEQKLSRWRSVMGERNSRRSFRIGAALRHPEEVESYRCPHGGPS